MCLTEAHAGSDLGIIRTKAEPNEDGSYAITGQKIFISAGEHDMADNIVHIVLARLPVHQQYQKVSHCSSYQNSMSTKMALSVSVTPLPVVRLNTKWVLKPLQLRY